jgi:hypothetical protein
MHRARKGNRQKGGRYPGWDLLLSDYKCSPTNRNCLYSLSPGMVTLGGGGGGEYKECSPFACSL